LILYDRTLATGDNGIGGNGGLIGGWGWVEGQKFFGYNNTFAFVMHGFVDAIPIVFCPG
jgi:hypothetical protein